MNCARCGAGAARGALCAACAHGLGNAQGLLPGHIVSRAAGAPLAWLVDAFGVPHALAAAPTDVGRDAGAGLAIQNGSVSRAHAELRPASGGWQLRDVGSKNGTFVDGARVTGRVTVALRSVVTFGDVGFYLVDQVAALAASPDVSIETGTRAGGATRYTVTGDAIELLLLGAPETADEAAGGVVLYRAAGAATWSELDLPRLEHQLLSLLAAQAVADGAIPSPTRGTVATKQLARKLPFQSKWPSDENVRQVVRRLRTSLEEIGAGALLGTAPGRGYFLTWPVARG